MNQRHVIPLIDQRRLLPPIVLPKHLRDPSGHLADTRGRALHDLRISVTDRCNFRCTYCMPKEVFGSDYAFVSHSALLTFEEISRLARLFVEHGVEKIRLTGGEPLLRKDIERLVAMLAGLRTPEGNEVDLTLTTNGALLGRKARSLKNAGLKRITVSLDGLDDTVFRQMNDVDFPVAKVLGGIEAAIQVGLGPVKINMVVQRGVNEDQIIPMATHFRSTDNIVRFIEYMDVGASNGWKLEQVVPSREVIEMIDRRFPIEPIEGNYFGEVAQRWRYRDGEGEIGVISSVTQAFCGSCTRARLSTEGQLYTCLFATRGSDLRELLRNGATDLELSNAIGSVWSVRADRYSEVRAEHPLVGHKVEMSYIGG